MRIRHVVGRDNVGGAGTIVDPLRARHCVVVAGKIADLAGEVDPLTHVNLDFPEHRLGPCIVAERLERSAPVLRDDDRVGFRFAVPPADAMQHLGPVDLDERRIGWLAAHRARRRQRG